jgi:hypothetical protein
MRLATRKCSRQVGANAWLTRLVGSLLSPAGMIVRSSYHDLPGP